ncbi:MAG TPA: membrane protein insertase YidC [Burkholderiaceae bacterium]|nr:membrane protein insertase YidC [Burkholderiaceae bacterium]
MGTDFQRTVLWVFFGMSLFLLWDRWQVHTGKPSMFGTTPTPPVASAPAEASKAPAAPVAPGAVPAAPSPAAAPAVSAAPGAVPAQGPSAEAAAKAPPVVIQTDLLKVAIDPEGAVVSHAELLKEKVAPDWTASGLLGLVTGKQHDAGRHTVLLEVSPSRVYVAQTGVVGGSFPNHRTAFRMADGPRELGAGQETLAASFVSEGGGVRVTKTYTFHRGRYDIDVTHEVANIGDVPVMPSLYLQVLRDGNKPEGESSLYYTYTGPVVYTEQEKFKKVEFSAIEKNKPELPKAADNGWVGMIQHYFVTAWVPAKGERQFYARSVDKNLYSVGTLLPLGTVAPGAAATQKATLYIGPQNQRTLAAIAPGLDLVVDYGWLTFLAKPIYWLLEFLHGIVGNWGWAIVLLTVLIKAAFYPLSAASYKSMAKMKEVTPRLTKLREQYAEDKQKMNTAMMELYRNEKINPLGGCLPILVQIPVFISLYWVLLASVEMRNAPWMLWVTDLATPDAWFILPALMMATMWIQYKLNPTPPDPVQAKVMMFMPLIFGVMFFFFPAGLVLYWLTNNILSIAQQWYVTKQIEKAKKPG